MRSKTVISDDFLGRWWMLLTLLSAAISVAAMIALGWIGQAFLTGTGLVAMSITTRLTWDKRDHPHYSSAMIGLIALQVLLVLLFGSHVQRSAGAIFMAGALVEAVVMIAVVRTLV
jgi:hypothetical protein